MKETIVLEFRKVVYIDEELAHEIGEQIEEELGEEVEYTGYYVNEELNELAEEW